MRLIGKNLKEFMGKIEMRKMIKEMKKNEENINLCKMQIY